MLTYPQIDPVLLEIGPLAIRWYSLAYIGGILLGAWHILWLNKKSPTLPNLKPFDNMLVWAIFGIILGGRLGYVAFYQPDYFMDHPKDILKIWQGGMSFHGGLIGFTLAMWLFAKISRYPFLGLMDLCATAAPIGLFLGRLANFINGELYGRITDSPLAMIFPHSDGLPRHPSQLYEAFLEGAVTYLILRYLSYNSAIRHARGTLAGSFLCCYAVSRLIVEHFREPDAQLGFIFASLTMGQLLSIPMLVLGIGLIYFATASTRPRSL